MNTLKYIITAILALLLLSYASAAPACPSDNNVVTANTFYYGQVCDVNDSDNNGVISIGANSITIDCNGMVLDGNMQGIAIANPGYDNVTIKNCLITDYNVGIWLNSAANSNKIQDSNITRTNFGIHILASTDTNIWDNNVDHNNATGIYIANDSNRTWISDNNLSDNNGSAIVFSAAGDANIRRNKISYNGRTSSGIGLDATASSGVWDINITDNNIISNWGDSIRIGNRSRIADNNLQIAIQGNIISVTADDVNITGNTIYGIATNGIFIGIDSNRLLISGNTIRRTGSGSTSGAINASSGKCSDVNVYNNIIDQNNMRGIFASQGTLSMRWSVTDNNVSDNNSNGIDGALSDSNILRNQVSYNSNGIWNYGVAGTVVSIADNNIIGNIGVGVYASASADVNIYDNNVRGNGSHGIAFGFNSDFHVELNDINGNLDCGIYTYARAYDVNIIKNTITYNGNGGASDGGICFSKPSADVNIHDNNISNNNKYGIYGAGGFDINFFNNTVKDNITNDVYLNDTNISFIDGNYGSIAFADINAKISRYWSVDINVRRSDTYASIADANIDVNSQYSAALTGRLTTGSDGTTGKASVFEYDQNFDSTAPYYYSPHKVIASHGAFDTNAYTKTIDSNSTITIYMSPRGVSITSPVPGQTLSSTYVTFSYAASSDFTPVSAYWIKLDDQPLYTSNGTSTTYSATLTSGAHTVYVIANGPGDVNSPVATISFTINLGAGSAQCGDGVCGSGETAASCAADCPPVCGDNACTGTETPETCAADCVVGCGDNICDPDAGETCSTCAADCGACAPGEEQIPAEETVLEQTQTGQATIQQIEDVLRDVGFTVSEIEAAKDAGTKLSIARTITVEKKAAEEGVPEEYESKITLAVTNTTSSALKNVRVVEVIPKSIANTSDEATSARPFAVLKSDPVIQFSIAEIPAGGEAEVSYTIAKKLSEEQIAGYAPPIPAYAIEAAEATCANVKCDDHNPCTDDLCFDGECAYVYAKDGTTCGFGEECMQGICRSVAFARSAAAGAGIDMMTITAIVIVIAAAAVGIAIYIRRR